MADVLVLQHERGEGPGAIERAVVRAGGRVSVVRVDRSERVPRSLDGASALVVLGGGASVYGSDLGDEVALVHRALAERRSVLGICLGSQILAAALGASVRPGTAREIGWREIGLLPPSTEDPLFSGLPERFTAFHWHGDVFDLPAGAVALASSARTACQAFRARDSVYGILFHLEVGRLEVEAMIDNDTGDLEAEGVDAAELRAGAELHLKTSEAIARSVFDRWCAAL